MKQTAFAALYLSIIAVLAPVPSFAETLLYNNIEASNFGTPEESYSFNIVTGSSLVSSVYGENVIGQQFTLS
jgi:hypothetical protein